MTNKQPSKVSKLSPGAKPHKPRRPIAQSLKQIFAPAKEFFNSITPENIELLNAEYKAELTAISFKLTRGQLMQLDEMCQGNPRTDYIRYKLFEGTPSQPGQVISEVNRDTYLELSKISKRLKPIARAIYVALKYGSQPLPRETIELMNHLDQTMVLLKQVQQEFTGQVDEEQESE